MVDQRQTDSYGLRPNKKRMSIINSILILLIIILAVLGIYFYRVSETKFPYGKALQAVFLDNGHVYFGMITRESSEAIVLSNVYYLQINNAEMLTAVIDNNEPFSLVKLGNELHEPEDTMFIFKTHILFIEQLRESSKIVVAIENYQRGE